MCSPLTCTKFATTNVVRSVSGISFESSSVSFCTCCMHQHQSKKRLTDRLANFNLFSSKRSAAKFYHIYCWSETDPGSHTTRYSSTHPCCRWNEINFSYSGWKLCCHAHIAPV
ncbi:hypothetical protein M758_3G060400 [Ceratodon purpureus]|nr:hypothetical protein M758_3G060400 [Ceratodon purpureus]